MLFSAGCLLNFSGVSALILAKKASYSLCEWEKSPDHRRADFGMNPSSVKLYCRMFSFEFCSFPCLLPLR